MKYQPNCSHGYNVTGSNRPPESNNSHHKKLIDVVKEVRNQQESSHSRSNGNPSKATTLQFAALNLKAKQKELHHNASRLQPNSKPPPNTEVNGILPHFQSTYTSKLQILYYLHYSLEHGFECV